MARKKKTLVIPEQLESALGFNITRLAALFKRELLIGLADFKLSPEQWQVLATLWWAERELLQVEIGFLTMKDKPTVSRMIDIMEKRGWVKKTVSTTDCRATSISLTKKGLELKNKVPNQLAKHFEPFLSQLSEKEHRELLKLTKKMRMLFNDGGNA